MARYKIVDRSPRFPPIVLDAQLMAGSFEYALDYLIDHEIDLSGIAKRYQLGTALLLRHFPDSSYPKIEVSTKAGQLHTDAREVPILW